MEPEKVERLRVQWEIDTVEVVRLRVANGTIGGGHETRAEARKWLKEKEVEAEAKRLDERKEDKHERLRDRWDVKYRWWITIVVGLLTFLATTYFNSLRSP